MTITPVILAGALSARFDGESIVSAVSALHASAGRPGGVIDLAMAREELNKRHIDSLIASRRVAGRQDGFSSNAGFHLARQLEFIHTEVLEEEFPAPNAQRLFSTDESVPVGATSHTMRRVYSHGEARVYRGEGDKVPRVGVTQREESWPIRHIVCGYGWDIFEAASSQFANSGLLRQNARVSRDAILNLQNRIWWQGAPQHDLYGILTYPWLPKLDMPVGFLAATVAAAPDATLRALHALVNFPHQTSKGVFYPDLLIMTNKVHDVLATTRFGTGSDTTILKHFLENSAHIKRVEIAWELEDAGGVGIDGMLACRADQQGIELVEPQGITQLPVFSDGLRSEIINYASIGGVVMRNVLNNVLGFCDTTT